MPIYEYVCEECGHQFDMMQKMGDNKLQKCEKCGALKANRMISKTSFVLKGTGWYATDYAGKKAHSSADDAPSAATAPTCPAKGTCAKAEGCSKAS